MAVTNLDGWTAPRLDRLEDAVDEIKASQIETKVLVGGLVDDTAEIKQTLVTMQTDQFAAVQTRLREVESRGRLWALGIGGPVGASFVVLALNHVFHVVS